MENGQTGLIPGTYGSGVPGLIGGYCFLRALHKYSLVLFLFDNVLHLFDKQGRLVS